MTTPTLPDGARLAPEAFAERAQAIEREIGQVIVGQAALVRQTLTGLLANSHVLLEGVPGLGKTMLVRTHRRRHRLLVQSHPVHAGPHAGRHHRHEHPHRGGRAAGLQVPAGSDLRATSSSPTRSTARRPKTQSSLLEAMQEHQVTVARQRFAARSAVLRPRDPEPARDGRHLPAARGTAGPLHLQGDGPVPVRGGPRRDHGPDDRLGIGDSLQGLHGGRDRRDAASGPGRADRPARHGVRRERPGGDPSRPAQGARPRPRLRALRRLAPRRPGARHRRQDLRPARRPVQRRRSTTSGPSPSRPSATGSS